MAEKIVGPAHFFYGFPEQVSGFFDGFVALAQAVFIVKSLEIIKIGMDEYKFGAFFDAPFHIFVNGHVSGKFGQGIGAFGPGLHFDQRLRHVIEGFAEFFDFIAGLDVHAQFKFAAGYFFGCVIENPDGLNDGF